MFRLYLKQSNNLSFTIKLCIYFRYIVRNKRNYSNINTFYFLSLEVRNHLKTENIVKKKTRKNLFKTNTNN